MKPELGCGAASQTAVVVGEGGRAVGGGKFSGKGGARLHAKLGLS